MSATSDRRAALQRRALRLEYATIAWNLGEAVLTIALGVLAGSLALIGFGADPIIEVFASAVVAYLAVTAVVMFTLAAAKHRLARALGSSPLRSVAAMPFLDGILSSATLLGLALNAVLGWWWADPLAALVVAVAAVDEARENLEEARELTGG